MPKAVRKTKGSVGVDRGNPLSAQGAESGHGCGPSAADRVWAGRKGHTHSSGAKLGECMGREVTECPLGEGTTENEVMGCEGQTVLLQDQARLRRLASNSSVLVGVAAQPCRGHKRNCDLPPSVAVLQEDSDRQKSCDHLFQNVDMLHEDSDYLRSCDHLLQNNNIFYEDLNLQVYPFQSGCQDVRVTWAMPVASDWGITVPCNILPKKRNLKTLLSTKPAPFAFPSTAQYNSLCVETSPLSKKQKHLRKHFEGGANTPPELLKDYPSFTSSSSNKQRMRGEAATTGNIDNYPSAIMLEETPTVMHYQGRANTPQKLFKKYPSCSGSNSSQQGVRGEAEAMGSKDKCQRVVMLEETPTMLLSICKEQHSQVHVIRYAVDQQGNSHQQGQHGQNLCTDANKVHQSKGSHSSDEASPSQATSLQNTFVCLSDQTYSITPGEVNYIIDAALPPLPSFGERKLNSQEKDSNMPKPGSSSGTSGGVGGGPSMLPVSTPCTVPFTTISSYYTGDTEAMILLRNSAFDSFLEAGKGRTKPPSTLLSSHCGGMPERNMANGSYLSSQNTRVLNECQVVTQPAQVQRVGGGGQSVFSSSLVPQLHSRVTTAPAAASHSLNSQVVWTAQDPKFSVPLIIPPEREDKSCHVNPQPGDRWRGLNSVSPYNDEDSASFHQDINFSARMVEEYKRKESLKTESNLIMPGDSARDSVWFSDGRSTLKTSANRSILGEYSTDINLSNGRTYSTTDSQTQAHVEARPLLGEGDSLAMPSTFTDFLIDSEEDDMNAYTQPDEACKMLPYYEVSGVDEKDVVAKERAQGCTVDTDNEVKVAPVTSANISAKTPWLDDNMNAGDFNDLLDSLLGDLEGEKVVDCAADFADGVSSNSVDPSTSNTEEAREDKPLEKSQEHILKNTSGSDYSVDINKGEHLPRPLLLKVLEKDLSKDVALLVPVTSLSHLHKTSPNTQQSHCKMLNTNTNAKIPQTVSFRTVPSLSGCGIVHLTTQNAQIKPTLVNCLNKGKQTETKGEALRYARELSKNTSNYSGQKKCELPSNYSTSGMQPGSQNVAYCSVNENTKLTLPIGETGISINIPKYASVNVKSFLTSESPKDNPPHSQPVSAKQWWPEFNSSSVVKIAPALLATAASLKVGHSPQINSKSRQQSGKKILLSQTVTRVVSASAQTDLIKLQPAMSPVLVTPVSKESLVPCVVPQGALTHTSSESAVTGLGALLCKKTATQYYLRSAAYPHISTSEMVKLVPHPETSSPFCPSTKVEQPVIIQIKSCTKSSIDTATATKETRSHKRENMNETGENLQRQIVKKKSYPDSFESRKELMQDLKELLPEFSDSVLNMLHLPPKAIHRGYFSASEQKLLKTQALGIHLDIYHKAKDSSCSLDGCTTCAVIRQRRILTWGEQDLKHYSKKNKGRTVRKQPKGKKREGSLRYDTEDEDDLYFRSPSQAPLKGEFTKSKDNYLGAHCKRAKENIKKESVQKSPFLLRGKSRAWGRGKVKRSSSDTDLLHLIKKEAAKGDKNGCFDDLHLIAHPGLQSSHGHRLYSSPQGSSTSPFHSLSSTPSKGKESPCRRETTPRTKSHMYNLRSDHWASVCRTAAANLRLKKELMRGHVPYTEHQNAGESRASCRGPHPEHLIIDISSITIGTVHTLAEEGPLSWPKLHVDFSYRKLTYVFHVMKKKNGNKLDVSLRTVGESGETSVMKQDDHEPASCGQNKTLAQTFFVVDVPFTCLRALNITSNKVMVLVDTLPGACLMSWSEEGWTSLPWSHPVGLACHARLTLFRALLAVSPMHQLCLQDGKDQAMQESLSRFSPWFKQTLSRPFPVQSEFAPSWALPFPAIPADLSSTTCTVSPSSLSPPSSSLSSITSLSPFLSSTFEDAAPQYTAFSTLPGVSAPNSNSPIPQSTPSSEVQGGAQHVQKPKGRVHSEQTTKPGLSDAGPAAALPAISSEPYIVSSVRAVLQAQGFTHVLPTKQPLQYPPNLCLEKGCSCRGMCRTMECPCARAGVLCHPNQSCCCENCDNPLNVLHVMGIDVQAARQDECLMQNLYNYNVGGLCSVLVSRVRLPCCGASPELLKVIPGTVTCSWCAAPVSYSWCSHYVHLQTLCPRSHCLECFRCKPVMNTHCQTCHVCTKTHEGKCAECGLNKF